MNRFQKLFSVKRVSCPRCLGKSYVDESDIKRLKKELKWMPGKCAYCNGRGSVSPDMQEKVPVDMSYLTSGLSFFQRNRVLKNKEYASHVSQVYDEQVDELIHKIKLLYFIRKHTIEEIIDVLITTLGQSRLSRHQRQEYKDYVQRVISSELK